MIFETMLCYVLGIAADGEMLARSSLFEVALRGNCAAELAFDEPLDLLEVPLGL